MAFELPYNEIDWFPYGGELTSANLNQAPKEIDANIRSINDRISTVAGNVMALYGRANSYDSDMNYMQYDVVRGTDAYYISLKDNNQGNSLNDTSYWTQWYIPQINNRAAVYNETVIIADSNQNDFTCSADPRYVDVYLNGAKLTKDTDFTIDENGTLVHIENVAAGDEVTIVGWNIGSILDVYNVKRIASSLLVKPGDFIVCDTNGETLDSGEVAFTVTLPLSSAVNNSIIQIIDGMNNAQNRPVKLTPAAGAKINGVAESMILDVNGFNITCVFDSVNQNWNVGV